MNCNKLGKYSKKSKMNKIEPRILKNKSKQNIRHRSLFKWKENYFWMNFREFALLVESINWLSNLMRES